VNVTVTNSDDASEATTSRAAVDKLNPAQSHVPSTETCIPMCALDCLDRSLWATSQTERRVEQLRESDIEM
jgi:hypothetical protein